MRGLDMAITIEEFEKMAYDEVGNEICKPIVVSKQKVNMEIEIINLGDADNIKAFMKEFGYHRTFFGCEHDHIQMEFERG
jgi:hypothetical protein